MNVLISRRQFLASLVALGLIGPGFLLADEASDRPNLTFGVLSDIHIIGPWAPRMNADCFVKALRWFDAQGVDGVVIGGDLTQYGMVKELEAVGDAWFSVFPDNRRSDGGHVEPLFVYGDHDTSGGTHRQKWARAYYPDVKACEKDLIVNNDRAALWKRIFREEFHPIVHKNVKGYDFILAHYTNVKGGGSVTPGLVDFVRAHAPKFDPAKPFFYVQHRSIVNTYRGGAFRQSQDARDALSPYANAFAFTSDTHYNLADEQTCWQGDFTCVGTASLRYVGVLAGRENSSKPKKPTQMQGIQCRASKQGMLARVYDDRVVLVRRDFEVGDSLGADWVVPVLKAGEKTHWSVADRMKGWKAPEFPADAKATVKKLAKGRISVEFPPVKSSEGRLRAFDYEVAVETRDGDGWKRGLVKRVFSPGGPRPESCEPKRANCIFAADKLPSLAEIRFAIRPTDSFGQTGRTIYAAASLKERRNP